MNRIQKRFLCAYFVERSSEILSWVYMIYYFLGPYGLFFYESLWFILFWVYMVYSFFGSSNM